MCAALRFLHRQSGCLSDTHVRRVRPEQEAQASPQPRGGRSLQAAWAHGRLSPLAYRCPVLQGSGGTLCGFSAAGLWRNTVRLPDSHPGPQVPGAAGLWRNTVAHRCPVLRGLEEHCAASVLRGLEELCAAPRQSPWSQMWRLLSGLPVAGSSPSALEARLSAERSAEEHPASSQPPPGLWPTR